MNNMHNNYSSLLFNLILLSIISSGETAVEEISKNQEREIKKTESISPEKNIPEDSLFDLSLDNKYYGAYGKSTISIEENPSNIQHFEDIANEKKHINENTNDITGKDVDNNNLNGNDDVNILNDTHTDGDNIDDTVIDGDNIDTNKKDKKSEEKEYNNEDSENNSGGLQTIVWKNFPG